MMILYPAIIALVAMAVLLVMSPWKQRYVLALACLAGAVPAAFFAVTEGLSRPLPVEWTILSGETEVLEAAFDRGETIFLWTRQVGKPPRYYTIEWDEELAEQLQDAMKEAEENGTSVMMGWPEEPSMELRDPMFHALPQPALPPKRAEPDTVLPEA